MANSTERRHGLAHCSRHGPPEIDKNPVGRRLFNQCQEQGKNIKRKVVTITSPLDHHCHRPSSDTYYFFPFLSFHFRPASKESTLSILPAAKSSTKLSACCKSLLLDNLPEAPANGPIAVKVNQNQKEKKPIAPLPVKMAAGIHPSPKKGKGLVEPEQFKMSSILFIPEFFF